MAAKKKAGNKNKGKSAVATAGNERPVAPTSESTLSKSTPPPSQSAASVSKKVTQGDRSTGAAPHDLVHSVTASTATVAAATSSERNFVPTSNTDEVALPNIDSGHEQQGTGDEAASHRGSNTVEVNVNVDPGKERLNGVAFRAYLLGYLDFDSNEQTRLLEVLAAADIKSVKGLSLSEATYLESLGLSFMAAKIVLDYPPVVNILKARAAAAAAEARPAATATAAPEARNAFAVPATAAAASAAAAVPAAVPIAMSESVFEALGRSPTSLPTNRELVKWMLTDWPCDENGALVKVPIHPHLLTSLLADKRSDMTQFIHQVFEADNPNFTDVHRASTLFSRALMPPTTFGRGENDVIAPVDNAVSFVLLELLGEGDIVKSRNKNARESKGHTRPDLVISYSGVGLLTGEEKATSNNSDPIAQLVNNFEYLYAELPFVFAYTFANNVLSFYYLEEVSSHDGGAWLTRSLQMKVMNQDSESGQASSGSKGSSGRGNQGSGGKGTRGEGSTSAGSSNKGGNSESQVTNAVADNGGGGSSAVADKVKSKGKADATVLSQSRVLCRAMPIIVGLDLNRASARVKTFRIVVNMARLIPLLHRCVESRPVKEVTVIQRNNGSQLVHIIFKPDNRITKAYVGSGWTQAQVAGVKALYEAAVGLDNVIQVDLSHDHRKELVLKPRCIPHRLQPYTTLKELLQALSTAFSAVASLHDRGVCHRDIRWPNILRYEEGESAVKFYLIDLDEGVLCPECHRQQRSVNTPCEHQDEKHFTSGPRSLSTDEHHASLHSDGNKHGYEVDLWGLGHIVDTSGYKDLLTSHLGEEAGLRFAHQLAELAVNLKDGSITVQGAISILASILGKVESL